MARTAGATWHTYLQPWSNTDADVLISAEQFAPQPHVQRAIRSLQRITAEHGFELTIIIFIRSQLDYINSRYGYSLKHFYHSKTFAEYVEDVLNTWSSETRARRKRRKGRIFLISGITFRPSCRNKATDSTCASSRSARPIRSVHPVPGHDWSRCISALGPSPGRQPQPTHRSTGDLAGRVVASAEASRNRSPETISDSTSIIPKEVEFRGWKDGSFWGFNASIGRRVYHHFKASNDLFAHLVWRRPWRTCSRTTRPCCDAPRTSLCPRDQKNPFR